MLWMLVILQTISLEYLSVAIIFQLFKIFSNTAFIANVHAHIKGWLLTYRIFQSIKAYCNGIFRKWGHLLLNFVLKYKINFVLWYYISFSLFYSMTCAFVSPDILVGIIIIREISDDIFHWKYATIFAYKHKYIRYLASQCSALGIEPAILPRVNLLYSPRLEFKLILSLHSRRLFITVNKSS